MRSSTQPPLFILIAMQKCTTLFCIFGIVELAYDDYLSRVRHLSLVAMPTSCISQTAPVLQGVTFLHAE